MTPRSAAVPGGAPTATATPARPVHRGLPEGDLLTDPTEATPRRTSSSPARAARRAKSLALSGWGTNAGFAGPTSNRIASCERMPVGGAVVDRVLERDCIDAVSLDHLGNVYVSNRSHQGARDDAGNDFRLSVLRPNGSVRWEAPRDRYLSTAPIQLREGVAVVAETVSLYSRSGRPLWESDVTAYATSPATSPSGAIELTNRDGHWQLLPKTGEAESLGGGGNWLGAPQLDDRGRRFGIQGVAGRRQTEFVVAHPNGTVVFRRGSGERAWGTPTQGPDGTFYVPHSQGVATYSREGSPGWEQGGAPTSSTRVLVGPRGDTYWRGWDDSTGRTTVLVGRTKEGEERTYPSHSAFVGEPAFSLDGTLAIGCQDGTVLFLSRTLEELGRIDVGQPISGAVALDANGRLWVPTHSGVAVIA